MSGDDGWQANQIRVKHVSPVFSICASVSCSWVGQHLLCSIVLMDEIMNKVLPFYTTWRVVGFEVGSTAV